MQAASGDEPEAANFLIFFIKFSLVAGASDQDIRHPGGRLTHDGGNAADIGSFMACFQLVTLFDKNVAYPIGTIEDYTV